MLMSFINYAKTKEYSKKCEVHQSYSTMGQLVFTSVFVRSLVVFSGTFQFLFAFLLFPVCLTGNLRAAPLIANTAYIWAWNAPTDGCNKQFNVPLDLSLFSLVGNPRRDATGQNLTIFYVGRLGNYPYIDIATQQSVDGGIPQLASLQQHLNKAKNDIRYYIPQDKSGLAVIDWEEWRPTWERNWKPKDIYRQRSMELVRQQNKRLNDSEVYKKAKRDFEKAAKDFMLETLKLAKSERPQSLWGYYLFPDCYNHNYNIPNYNGSCFDIDKRRNDQLSWLWKESMALYPSIYLNTRLRRNRKATLFARNRIQEAIRVSVVRNVQEPLPIYLYTRPVFTDASGEYLSQVDLVNTIGESIALGASGIVVWGTFNLSQSRQSCMDLNIYMKTTLNLYIINVTLAAKLCNQLLCQEQGVCIRKHWNSNDYLHLNPNYFSIEAGKGGKYVVYGKPTLSDLKYFSEKFHCGCYPNVNCSKTVSTPTADSVGVCVIDDICVEGFLNKDMSVCHNSSTTPSNVSSSTPPTTPCFLLKTVNISIALFFYKLMF